MKEFHFIGPFSNASLDPFYNGSTGLVNNSNALLPANDHFLSDEELLTSSTGHWSNVTRTKNRFFVLFLFIYFFLDFLQVELVLFKGVSQCVRKIVLNSIVKDNLRKLSFVNCLDIDLVAELLLPFNRLENLSIENSTMATIDDVDELNLRIPLILADCGLFLPKLKILSTKSTCLGHWSRSPIRVPQAVVVCTAFNLFSYWPPNDESV